MGEFGTRKFVPFVDGREATDRGVGVVQPVLVDVIRAREQDEVENTWEAMLPDLPASNLVYGMVNLWLLETFFA